MMQASWTVWYVPDVSGVALVLLNAAVIPITSRFQYSIFVPKKKAGTQRCSPGLWSSQLQRLTLLALSERERLDRNDEASARG